MEINISRSEISGEIAPPCSKSYAQRAFAAALLCKEESILRNIELCDDAKTTFNVIEALGAKISSSESSDDTFKIKGGLYPKNNKIYVADSGLAVRLFSPIIALSEKELTLHGDISQDRRNFEKLLNPLKKLGANVSFRNGRLPVKIKGPLRGGEIHIAETSSQFLTGLLIALPLIEEDTVLHIDKTDSTSYIDMTIETIERFGGKIEHNEFKEFFIRGGQTYNAVDYAIEGDWSSAAFWLVAGAISGEVTITNMNMLSRQADIAIIKALQRSGAEIITTNNSITVSRNALHGFEFDITTYPDLLPILTVLAANCDGQSIIKGIDTLSYGNLDRKIAILEEFPKLGIDLKLENECLIIKGGTITGGEVSSRNDHRIAMTEAIAGLTSTNGVRITSAEAVTKSYPTFWSDLNALTSDKMP